jgi:hypothetical protein
MFGKGHGLIFFTVNQGDPLNVEVGVLYKMRHFVSVSVSTEAVDGGNVRP